MENILLKPVFEDIVGNRMRKGLNQLRDAYHQQKARALGSKLQQVRDGPISKLLRSMFVKLVPRVEAHNAVKTEAPLIPVQFREKLNDSQIKAIHLAFKHRVSLIWGPAATGKTDSCYTDLDVT